MAEILVVEDYPELASALARNLRRRGHVVVTALTVAEALSYSHRAFDYAVLDIDLPDGNGVSLAERLLAHRCVIDIVFFTATRDAATLARAARLGKVIAKLGGVELLLQTLEQREASGRNSADVPPISRVVELRAAMGGIGAAAVAAQSIKSAAF